MVPFALLLCGTFVAAIPLAAQVEGTSPEALVQELETLIAPVPPDRIERAASLLNHPDASVRMAAARAVSRLHVVASGHFVELRRIAERTERYVAPREGGIAWGGAFVVAGMEGVAPPTESQLIAALEAGPGSVDALMMLVSVSREVGYSAETLERIRALAQHADLGVRDAVAVAIAKLMDWKDARRTILLLLKDDHATVRSTAVSVFPRFADPELAVARALLTDPNSGVRESACRALGACGKALPALVRELLTTVRDRSPDVSGAAALALAELDVFGAEAIAAIGWGIRRSDFAPRCVPMLRYCQQAGRRAAALVPEIEARLAADSPKTRVASLRALYLCTPDGAEGRMVLALCSALDDRHTRREAIGLLKDWCSGSPRRALPGLLERR